MKGDCIAHRSFVWLGITILDVWASVVNLNTAGWEGAGSASVMAWFFGDFFMWFFLLVMALTKDGFLDHIFNIWRWVHGFFEVILLLTIPFSISDIDADRKNIDISLAAGLGGLIMPYTLPKTCAAPYSATQKEDLIITDDEISTEWDSDADLIDEEEETASF